MVAPADGDDEDDDENDALYVSETVALALALKLSVDVSDRVLEPHDEPLAVVDNVGSLDRDVDALALPLKDTE